MEDYGASTTTFSRIVSNQISRTIADERYGDLLKIVTAWPDSMKRLPVSFQFFALSELLVLFKIADL